MGTSILLDQQTDLQLVSKQKDGYQRRPGPLVAQRGVPRALPRESNMQQDTRGVSIEKKRCSRPNWLIEKGRCSRPK